MKRLSLQITLLFFFSFMSGLGSAESIPKSIVCKSTVFEPYVMMVDGQVKGIDVEVIEEVGRRLGIDISFELKPWVRLEKDIESGEEVCAAAYFYTEDRAKYMDFTQVPLHITNYMFFVLAENAKTSLRLADMKGFKIGLNHGFKSSPAFEKAVEDGVVELEIVEHEGQSFKMLALNRINAVLTNEFVGYYQLKKNDIQNVKPLLPPLASTPAFFVFSKSAGYKHLVPEFNAVLFEILKDGTYQEIFDKYLN